MYAYCTRPVRVRYSFNNFPQFHNYYVKMIRNHVDIVPNMFGNFGVHILTRTYRPRSTYPFFLILPKEKCQSLGEPNFFSFDSYTFLLTE